MLINEDGQKIDTIEAIVDRRGGKPFPKSAIISPHGPPTINPTLQPVTTKIRYTIFDNKISSMVLEFSSEGEIHAINFDMYDNGLKAYGKHLKKYISLKNLFEKTFDPPQIYNKSDKKLAPISLHPLDFNPRDGGTFAIRYKKPRLLRPSKTVEVIISLIKNKGEWVLADEEGRPIKELSLDTAVSNWTVKEVIADWETSTQRNLKIRPCKESARALLL